jgi:hypothetical protein
MAGFRSARIQELVLGLRLEGPSATEVLCGPNSVTWKELSICLGYIKQNFWRLIAGTMSGPDEEKVRKHISRFEHLENATNLRPILSQTEFEWTRWLVKNLTGLRVKKCTDPRDRIFALYGLCRVSPQPLPNYNLTTSEVYRRFTVDAIRITRSLAILNDIEFRSTKIRVPSWVPDWTVGLERYTFREKNFLNGVGLLYVPKNVPVTDINTRASPEVLRLTGVVIDEIVYLCDAVTYADMKRLYEGVDSWLQTAWFSILSWSSAKDARLAEMEHESSNIVSESRTERFRNDDAESWTSASWWDYKSLPSETMFTNFIRTTIVNKELKGLNELTSDGESNFFELVSYTARSALTRRSTVTKHVKGGVGEARTERSVDRDILSQSDQGRDKDPANGSRLDLMMTSNGAPPPSQAKVNIMSRYLEYVYKPPQGRRVFVTKKGHMGLGVAGTAIGDQIAVLSAYGNIGPTPYCIRPKVTRYEFFGEAYVHGLIFNDDMELHWEDIDLI